MHQYTFKPIYRSDTPTDIPWHAVVLSVCMGALNDAIWAVKACFCLFLWIAVAPKVVVIHWKLMFMIYEGYADEVGHVSARLRVCS